MTRQRKTKSQVEPSRLVITEIRGVRPPLLDRAHWLPPTSYDMATSATSYATRATRWKATARVGCLIECPIWCPVTFSVPALWSSIRFKKRSDLKDFVLPTSNQLTRGERSYFIVKTDVIIKLDKLNKYTKTLHVYDEYYFGFGSQFYCIFYFNSIPICRNVFINNVKIDFCFVVFDLALFTCTPALVLLIEVGISNHHLHSLGVGVNHP